MAERSKYMALGAFLTVGGHHVAGWRYEQAGPSHKYGLKYWMELAQAAEEGKFDLIFLADTLAGIDPGLGPGAGRMVNAAPFDPLLLLAALAAGTEQIGLVATMTTTYSQPYDVARRTLSLDNLSGGRVGWNIVTSGVATEAGLFGAAKHPEREDRYARAAEFVDVVVKLWESWPEGAFPIDRDSGIFVDLQKRNPVQHSGKHFRVEGSLACERSPQGRPLLVQAGSSGPGIDLASSRADVVFTAQTDFNDAKAFYGVLGNKSALAGRDAPKIMPGIVPIVGATDKDAQDTLSRLQELIHPEVAIALLTRTLGGQSLAGMALDEPPPESLLERPGSRVQLVVTEALEKGYSLLEMARRAAIGRGHRVVAGTAAEIADTMELWFREKAADGFNVMPPYLPNALHEFSRTVIPLLVERGLRPAEYQGNTLRRHLGLD